jgi:lipopolysaccharide transport system permease protein
VSDRPTAARGSLKSTQSLIAARWHLVKTIAGRELSQRYRDSALGIVWAVVLPLCLLAIYGFVFSQVFVARWDTPTGEKGQFALLLFSGLIIFNVFSETVNGATSLIDRNANLIRRTQFPAAMLPVSSLVASLYTLGFSFVPFSVLYLTLEGLPPWTFVLTPLVLMPLLTITLGISFLLSAVAAFVRDLKHLVGLATTMMLFTSPIFFPTEIIPESFVAWARWLNPLMGLIPETKDVLFWGLQPDWILLLGLQAIGFVLLWLGTTVFRRLAPGFADVV